MTIIQRACGDRQLCFRASSAPRADKPARPIRPKKRVCGGSALTFPNYLLSFKKKRGYVDMPKIQFRTDKATKLECAALFDKLGLSMPDAINLFLRQSLLHGGLPFEVKVPRYNQTTPADSAGTEQSKGKDGKGIEEQDA
jgi:DNA-damage-inducible protein J